VGRGKTFRLNVGSDRKVPKCDSCMGYIGGIWAAAALIFCHGGHIFSLSHLNDLLVGPIWYPNIIDKFRVIFKHRFLLINKMPRDRYQEFLPNILGTNQALLTTTKCDTQIRAVNRHIPIGNELV
jgi:hypothetical protein